MADQRIVKLAKLLVNYSLKIKKGDYLLIEGYDIAYPLIKEVYREAIRKGAHVETYVSLPGLNEIFLKEASDEQLKFVSPMQKFAVEKFDAILSIWGGYNEKALSNIDSEKIQKRRTATREINIKFINRASEDLKWCGTLFPTHASAQEANMGLEEYEDFVYGAGLLDKDDPIKEWMEISKKQEKICEYLNSKKTLHIISKDTDLKMSIEGRRWINCDGRENFPDGEVFTTPIENTVEGYIRFSYPGIFVGKEIEDIRLEFKEGKVVKATAAKGEDLLHALLDTDEGARYLGEIAIGTNYGIQKFTKNMLFDEKMGGTVHAAIGAAPKETGGNNESGIHWDMLCDMKNGGRIYADGELFYKDGKFLID
ncbi:Leucyl aminopeptidase (aminopeptidase T) [Caloranaerobacter azorensis DSM 13643]|uniref:Leucyl aminopeptidase (Aminopeptidase T) n=1 Tax=Caloranaerobacter azorensis DSM 13643 TaxID=1121264 RepID=A0A1M5RHY8_9FIRM|nr:aminopeptidase [Caloranaerobacter azorensis]SHH25629.1 Leucyl aminopeptidase (aminopeptidase T) [Caloranaerobacter azorensis DSM 13643]